MPSSRPLPARWPGCFRRSGEASAETDAAIEAIFAPDGSTCWPRLKFGAPLGAPEEDELACAVCGSTKNAMMCKGCRSARFCNEACQRSAWTDGHREECRARAAIFTEMLRRRSADVEDVPAEERAYALYELAVSLIQGIGCKKDILRGAEAMRRAAAAGCHDAALIMAAHFKEGNAQLGIAKDEREFLRLARIAAGSSVLSSENKALADYMLGQAYFAGIPGLLQVDRTESTRLFRQSAASGFAEAQLTAGLAILEGDGTARNGAEGARLLRLAAEQNLPAALYDFGCILFSGEGVAKDTAAANEMWRRGAALGSGDCAFNLGNSLLNGIGIAKDVRQACEFFAQSASKGHKAAEGNLIGVVMQAAEGANASRSAKFFAEMERHGAGRTDAASASKLKTWLKSKEARGIIFD
jgi:TPR repeat protein